MLPPPQQLVLSPPQQQLVNPPTHQQPVNTPTFNPTKSTAQTFNMASGISLKKFDGSENVHVWLRMFENWQTFHNISDVDVLNAVGSNFEGQAATWLQTLTSTQTENLQIFKECLRNRFCATETNTLLGLRQAHGESTSEYLSRAEKTSLGHELSENYKVQFAINRLHTQIKKYVVSKQPKTFQQLRHAVDVAIQELERDSKQELDIQALTLQIKETLRNETLNALPA